ncbi:MAG: hypothetical protein KKG93_16390, partial [Bacteroidetes bacterium]|nr:hypothetical protein [Bacteroidota bacterium]
LNPLEFPICIIGNSIIIFIKCNYKVNTYFPISKYFFKMMDNGKCMSSGGLRSTSLSNRDEVDTSHRP